jgi:hypothetical protein
MDPSSSSLFLVLPKSVEELSKRLKSKMVDTVTLQKLIDCKCKWITSTTHRFVNLFIFPIVAIRYWRNSELTEDDWKNLVCDSYLPETIFQELFSGILTLTLSVFHLSEKKFIPDVVVKELTSLGYTK